MAAEVAAKDPAHEPTPEESLFGEIGPALPESADTIETIRADIGNCTRCPLIRRADAGGSYDGEFQRGPDVRRRSTGCG